MLIKPYGKKTGNDLWYRIPKHQDPDKLLTLFLLGKGEFSALAEVCFEESLKRRLENRKLIYV